MDNEGQLHTLYEGKPTQVDAEKASEMSEELDVKVETNKGDDRESYKKLKKLVNNSKILYSTKTVFPFTVFPDEVIIDKDKVAVINREFFGSGRVQTILIKNIADIYADVSLFFASLKISDQYFADKPIIISYLKKRDAIYMRDVIQGLMLVYERKIDISEMKEKEVLPYLEEIGRAFAKASLQL